MASILLRQSFVAAGVSTGMEEHQFIDQARAESTAGLAQEDYMRLNLQLKVGLCLGLLLLLAFGVTTWVSVTRTDSALKQASDQSLSALKKSGFDSARNVFTSLETSASASIERGEMELFQAMLSDMAAIPGLEEIGLTDAQGKILYAGRTASINQQMNQIGRAHV